MTPPALPGPLRARLAPGVGVAAERGLEGTRTEGVAEVTGGPTATRCGG